MTRKDVRNIKQLHSKKTGAMILIILSFFIVGTIVFIYLANNENNKFEIELQDFIKLSCKETASMDLNAWQQEAYYNKIKAGVC